MFLSQNCFDGSGSCTSTGVLDCLFYFCEKYDGDCTESVECFGEDRHFHNMDSSNPVIHVSFNFFHQDQCTGLSHAWLAE